MLLYNGNMPRKTELQKLAVRAIKLIDEAIEQDFGLKVLMGAELEFTLAKDHSPVYLTEVLPIAFSNDADYRPAAEKDGSDSKPAFFPDSPIVTKFYPERNLGKYEIVFSHMAKHWRPDKLPVAIDSVKRRIGSKKDGYGADEVFFETVEIMSINNLLAITNGLHINVSIERDGTNSLPTRNLSIGIGSDIFIENRFIEFFSESMLLLASTESSYRRFNTGLSGRHNAPTMLDRNEAIKFKGPFAGRWVEIRLPGAEADPYLAVLSGISGLYYSIMDREKIKIDDHGKVKILGHEEEKLRLTLPKNKTEAIERFERGTILRDMLNSLSGEERLGDRFHAAILDEARKPEINTGQGMVR